MFFNIIIFFISNVKVIKLTVLFITSKQKKGLNVGECCFYLENLWHKLHASDGNIFEELVTNAQLTQDEACQTKEYDWLCRAL